MRDAAPGPRARWPDDATRTRWPAGRSRTTTRRARHRDRGRVERQRHASGQPGSPAATAGPSRRRRGPRRTEVPWHSRSPCGAASCASWSTSAGESRCHRMRARAWSSRLTLRPRGTTSSGTVRRRLERPAVRGRSAPQPYDGGEPMRRRPGAVHRGREHVASPGHPTDQTGAECLVEGLPSCSGLELTVAGDSPETLHRREDLHRGRVADAEPPAPSSSTADRRPLVVRCPRHAGTTRGRCGQARPTVVGRRSAASASASAADRSISRGRRRAAAWRTT